MKKQFLLFIAVMLVSVSSLMAQEQRQRSSAEERTKNIMEKLAVLNLDADARAKTEVIFNDFFSTQQKAMQEMRASGSTDREAMMKKRQEFVNERDAKLKKVFTNDQMKKWMDEIEPGLRQQRAVNPAPPAPVVSPAPATKPTPVSPVN